MKKICIAMFACVLYCVAASTCLALEWKMLHEKADTLSMTQVLEQVGRAPDSPEAAYTLALVQLNDYDHVNARKIFERMAEQDPLCFEARWGIAECLRREHKRPESILILDEIIKGHPQFSPAYITLAYIRYIQSEFTESIILTGKVINQGKGNVDKANFLRAHGLYAAARGMLAHYGGPFSKAVNGAAVWKHLDIIQKLAPDSAVVNFGVGSYYLLIPIAFGRDLKKAEQYFLRAAEKDPRFPDIYVRLGQIYQIQGDEAKYQSYLQKALNLDTGNELALDIQSGSCKFICFFSEEKK